MLYLFLRFCVFLFFFCGPLPPPSTRLLVVVEDGEDLAVLEDARRLVEERAGVAVLVQVGAVGLLRGLVDHEEVVVDVDHLVGADGAGRRLRWGLGLRLLALCRLRWGLGLRLLALRRLRRGHGPGLRQELRRLDDGLRHHRRGLALRERLSLHQVLEHGDDGLRLGLRLLRRHRRGLLDLGLGRGLLALLRRRGRRLGRGGLGRGRHHRLGGGLGLLALLRRRGRGLGGGLLGGDGRRPLGRHGRLGLLRHRLAGLADLDLGLAGGGGLRGERGGALGGHGRLRLLRHRLAGLADLGLGLRLGLGLLALDGLGLGLGLLALDGLGLGLRRERRGALGGHGRLCLLRHRRTRLAGGLGGALRRGRAGGLGLDCGHLLDRRRGLLGRAGLLHVDCGGHLA